MKDVANDPEFKAKLKVLGDMYDRKEISKEKLHEEVNKLLGENGFFDRLKEYLTASVNSLISDSKKANLPRESEYFGHRANVERQFILSNNWISFWDNCTWLTNPTTEDVEDVKTLSNSDLETYCIILGKSLKQYCDENRETDPKCLMLYEFYKLVKSEIVQRPSLSDFPSGDGYQDYIANKADYQKEQNKVETARVTGSECPHCGSTDIASYGEKWRCRDCKKLWRKH